MGTLARAVITGFGFSLGAALYKRFSKQLGFEDANAEKAASSVAKEDAADDPADDC